MGFLKNLTPQPPSLDRKGEKSHPQSPDHWHRRNGWGLRKVLGMTTEQDALYRAICAFPDEDTPRLAFADLLEENGDPTRAAFIRRQVELARLPQWDPLWVKCRQFDPDAFRGWAMVHTLPAPPTGFSWQSLAFRRGLAWRVEAHSTAAFVANAGELFAAAPVRAVTLENLGRFGFREFADSPHLERVHRLEFAVTRPGADDLDRLGHSPHAAALTELHFSHNSIEADGLATLARSPLFRRLERLKLHKAVIPPALLVDALGAVEEPSLHRLDLPANGLTRYDADALFALPVLHDLEHLDLSDNPLTVEGIQSLAESGIVRGLRVLKLSKTRAGMPGLKSLLEAGGLAGVRILDLSANQLGPVAVQSLAEAGAVRGLRVLNLANNPFGDTGAIALAASNNLAGLLELDLADAKVGDAGAIALAESPHLEGLIRLNLRSHGRARRLGNAGRTALRTRFGDRVTL